MSKLRAFHRPRFLAVLANLVSSCHAMTAAHAGDLIGTRPPEWTLEGWMHSPPLKLSDLRGKVVLVRWWTAPECPHCAATAPALNQLHQNYSTKGLVVLGIYHHKSSTPLEPSDVAAHANRFGMQFPLAIDRDWTTLNCWWLKSGDRPWTSVSFLLDRDGVIRHIHPGGRYEVGSADFREMEAQVQKLLKEH